MRDEKNVEKNVNKAIASAGDADPGQGGFWWEDIPGRQARSSTPSLILRMGGRSRHPPRQLKGGGLEALRISGFNIGFH